MKGREMRRCSPSPTRPLLSSCANRGSWPARLPSKMVRDKCVVRAPGLVPLSPASHGRPLATTSIPQGLRAGLFSSPPYTVYGPVCHETRRLTAMRICAGIRCRVWKFSAGPLMPPSTYLLALASPLDVLAMLPLMFTDTQQCRDRSDAQPGSCGAT